MCWHERHASGRICFCLQFNRKNYVAREAYLVFVQVFSFVLDVGLAWLGVHPGTAGHIPKVHCYERALYFKATLFLVLGVLPREANGGSIVMGAHRNTQNTSQYIVYCDVF